MTQKISEIIAILEKHFPNPKPSLFHVETPFQFLIAVLLSGNSTDKTTNTVTPTLFLKAKNPYEMANFSQKELITIIKPCGLGNKKSLYILLLSKLICSKYNGLIPNSLEALLLLPGVGRKTALVFLSHICKQDYFPVDTHIIRCAQRWGLSKKRNAYGVEKDLVEIFPKNKWRVLHLQIIFYARKYCGSKKHSLNDCEICSLVSSPTNS